MGSAILHLSDLHVGQPGAADRLEKIVKKIMKKFGDRKLIILATGDIVDDGQKKQFGQAGEILKPLTENPLFTFWPAPGNHDYGWNGNHAERKRLKYFKNAFYGFENVSYPYVKHDDFGNMFIGLNSMKAECDFWDGLLADGELGSKQIHNLSGVLDKTDNMDPEKRKNMKVIVHLHHHPFIYPDAKWIQKLYEKQCHWLKDGEALMHTLAGRVDMLFFGHEHRHMDFSKTDIAKNYRIPYIFSGGQATTICKEYKLNKAGKPTQKLLHKGYLARLVEIGDDGNVSHRTVKL